MYRSFAFQFQYNKVKLLPNKKLKKNWKFCLFNNYLE